MEELTISYISVFVIPPSRKTELKIDDIVGGTLSINSDVNSIFLNSFNGILRRGLKFQPFHFNFEGTTRQNETRDVIIEFLQTVDSVRKDEIPKNLAFRLAKLIDNRSGEMLFIFAYGEKESTKRIVLWAFPHDDPIQLKTTKGIPKISEIQNAFSKSSNLRKACYLEMNKEIIGKNDLINGIIIDSSAHKGGTIANYWLEGFINGTIEVLSTRGTNDVLKYLKAAQKVSKTEDEKNSVRAIFYSLLSGSIRHTTMNDIGNRLVGDAKTEYLKVLPNTKEKDAKFTIDQEEAKMRIKQQLFILKNGIEVMFPTNTELDPDDFIQENENGKIMNISEKIDNIIYK